MRYKRTRIGLVLTVLIVVAVIAAPLFAPHNTTEFVGTPFTGPGGDTPLGTDNLGRDVLSRTLYGGRTVVWMSVSAATIGVALGLLIGLLAGYMRGWVDSVLMRGVDVLLAFPQIVLVLLFVALLGSEPWLIVLLVALVWAPQVSRVMRAVTMDVASREFVEAAEVLGQPRRRILARDILPNLATPLLVEFGLRIAWSIAAIAAVGFLGFGIQPPTADWGLMINENRAGLVSQPWAVMAPIICIALFSIATNLLAEGISRAVAGIDRITEGYGA